MSLNEKRKIKTLTQQTSEITLKGAGESESKDKEVWMTIH